MKMSLSSAALAAAILLALSPQLSAQQSAPKASAGEVATVTAKVVSVDEASREVVLEGSDGRRRTIVAGPEVKNLAKVKAGDFVRATYTQAVAIELKKGGDKVRSSNVQEETTRAKGEKPSGVAQRRVTLTGTVEQVDKASRLVSVKGPQGNVVDVEVAPSTLDVVEVGDQVELVYTEALAVDVTAGAK